jgi:hypothetical protein
MKRSLPDSSIQAWEEIQPKLGHKQQEVYDALIALGGKATNQEIATRLGVPLHHVTPRTGELMTMNKIKRGDRLARAYQLQVVTVAVQLKLELMAK